MEVDSVVREEAAEVDLVEDLVVQEEEAVGVGDEAEVEVEEDVGDGVVGETTIKVAETTLGVETQTIQRQSYDHARHGRRQAIVSTITTVTLLML